MSSNDKNSFADSLRSETQSAIDEAASLGAASVRNQIKTLAHLAAKQGNFELRIPLNGKGWSNAILAKAMEDLTNLDKLKVSVKNEITAFYSNTDCDSEEFLYVQW